MRDPSEVIAAVVAEMRDEGNVQIFGWPRAIQQWADRLEALSTPQPAAADVVMVPREPTPEMLEAADRAVNGSTYEVYPEEVHEIYRAMIDAALSTVAPVRGNP